MTVLVNASKKHRGSRNAVCSCHAALSPKRRRLVLADGAGVRFGEIARDVADGMRSGTIRLHAVLPVCSGFWVERSQKEYRQIAYAIFLEDIRFCKDVGVVDRILGHFECMVKRRMSHVRSA